MKEKKLLNVGDIVSVDIEATRMIRHKLIWNDRKQVFTTACDPDFTKCEDYVANKDWNKVECLYCLKTKPKENDYHDGYESRH
jgi:hypothetical protein